MTKSKIRKPGKQKALKPLGNSKKIFFILIATLLPCLFIGILEAGLRLFRYGSDAPMFVDTELFGREYRRCHPEYGKK